MDSVAAALDRLTEVATSRPVARLSQAFAEAGQELALVGGPVRDAFLGRSAPDLDFTTDATPERILEIVRPIASAHWDIGRAFGTIGAKVAGETVEITTYRADSYDADSRKPEVVFGDSLEGDLGRRDFTVNAMALRLPERVLVDPTGGLEDLMAGRLRTASDPDVSFDDDPLRMMRAARFTASLGFVLDDAARVSMTERAERIGIISAERVRDELVKLISSDAPHAGLELLVDTGIAERILPELPALRLTVDGEHRHKDVYEHSLTVLDQAIELEGSRSDDPDRTPDVVVRLAALLHDIGKPATRRFEGGGTVTFHHHDVVGAKLARKRLRALRFDNATIDSVGALIELHQRFFGYTEGGWTDSAVRRYVRDAGDQLERLHILTRADVTTRNRRKAERLAHAYDDLETRIAELAAREEMDSVRPDLTGEQIMDALDISPGPAVGRAYRFLLELRLDEGPLGEEEATRRLLTWWAEGGKD
ncbi:CCA tRNA nucleotidyltransferase [Amnibacterium flavum]|uniref:CCA tRNA nucleotidyltransferase n=1 Tax=Amnibacterium flavum TaxID=2173173 RepID=A0A2V1HWB9_9MICO|nr:CCA tRNA nucleotidyltransferase [Amnibacterium flavum]PVZ95469.1 CCA tRNA nucleotidyltransferase [Amnibacterium flavum]